MFSEYIAATRSEPFRWGQNDCALWCASAVLDATGYDPAADLRGTYGTRFECLQVLKRHGGLLGLIPPRMARFHPIADADGVAVVRTAGRVMCALIVDGRAIAKTDCGHTVADNFLLIKGWTWC